MREWTKNIISWRCGSHLYISVPFTWLLPEAKRLALEHKGRVHVGGPGAHLLRETIDWATFEEETAFDVLALHNPLATITSRGCPKRCPFCAVPIIEGDFRELTMWRAAPSVCDNNLLAASRKHFERVIESLRPFPFVDFNQGLDAALLKPWHLDAFKSLRSVRLRFAFDNLAQEQSLADAIQRCRASGLNNLAVYVLVGYKDDLENALYRLEWVRSWGIRPNPMRYQPLKSLTKNSYVGPGWTEADLRRVMHYYARLRWYEHIPFAEFQRGGKTTLEEGKARLLDR